MEYDTVIIPDEEGNRPTGNFFVRLEENTSYEEFREYCHAALDMAKLRNAKTQTIFMHELDGEMFDGISVYNN